MLVWKLTVRRADSAGYVEEFFECGNCAVAAYQHLKDRPEVLAITPPEEVPLELLPEGAKVAVCHQAERVSC